jgi:ATP-binding cassette subfamily F protein 3
MIMLSADAYIVDLNALAWLEDYLQTWPGTLVVV